MHGMAELQPPDTAAGRPEDARHRAPCDMSAEVLVIDDDPALVALFVTLLDAEEGLSVHGANSAAHALAWQPAAAPALIFLDLHIPGEQPTDSLRALRGRPGWGRTQVVICSADEPSAAWVRELGVAGYLPKPFDLDAVVAYARLYARFACARGLAWDARDETDGIVERDRTGGE